MQTLRMVVLAGLVCFVVGALPATADTYYELGIPDGGGGWQWETITPLLFPDPGNPGQFLDCDDFYNWAPPVMNYRAEWGSTTSGPGSPRQWGLDNLDDNLLTCFIYGNDVDIPIQLFCVYGHPANDDTNSAADPAVLNISGLPATATKFEVYDDVENLNDDDWYGDGDDTWNPMTKVATIVNGDTQVYNEWTQWYTDGFVITALEPTGPTSNWYYDILFDLDFDDKPPWPNDITGVQWLTGDVNSPTVAHSGVFGYVDDMSTALPASFGGAGDLDWVLRITPEPATMALFATGLSSLGLYIRRRRRKS